jgi:SAM-dependent methyltransferase
MSENKPPEVLPEAPLTMSGLDEATPSEAEPNDARPKLRSQPVLSVGASSPPPRLQALASAPAARVPMPSTPVITNRDDSAALLVTTPSPGTVASGQHLIVAPSQPTSDPPSGPGRSRPDSQPPGRKLAPPPKPRRDSSPISEAPPEGQAQLLPPLLALDTPSFEPPVTAAPAAAPAVTVPPVTMPPVSGPPAPMPPVASVPPRPVASPPRPTSGAPQAAVPAAGGLPQILPAAPAANAASSPPPADAGPFLSPFAQGAAAEPVILGAAAEPGTMPSASPVPPPPTAFVAPSPVPAAPAIPGELALEAGGTARVTPPQRQSRPPPRSSEPPPPAHVIVPTDAAPLASKPTPAPAIQVMRIIAIGNPTVAKPPEVLDDDVEEIAEEAALDNATTPLLNLETTAALAEPPLPTELGEIVVDTTELDDADLAPDSQDGPKAAAEAVQPNRDDAAPHPATEIIAEAPASDVKPPPPPRRPQPPKRPDTGRPRARRALKRPWWEELFGEDFSRAVPRLTEKQITREVDFIEESLGVAKGGVVLDLGCGSGHHAVELASRGYGVVGYDLSVYQLALAADVAQERDQRINFLQGDMREMAFEAMFDGIYCWNTTFGFFEEDKNVAVAERVFRALKPGGMFLLDMANRDFAAAYSPSQLWYEGDSCVCMDDMNVDFITSRLRVKRSVIFDDGRSRECVYSIRLYSLHELGKLLHDVGFRVTEASGQTATPGVFFGEHSPRLIVLAQKP